MATVQEQLARLRRYRASVQANDPQLGEELRDLGVVTEGFTEALPTQLVEQQIVEESIIMRRERPVLAIKENVTQLVFVDEAESEIWRSRLSQAKPLLDDAIRAVGRVNLTGGQLDWVGTGWLVAENVIVTNRHVAWEFAERGGDGFTFKMGLNEQIAADIDFLQEIESPARLVFQLVKPLHIEDAPGPDVAFFEVMTVSGNAKLAKPIDLAASIAASQNVATIGYPAYDSRIPEPELMERIYGKIYNKKRLAPGGVTRVEQTRALAQLHDARRQFRLRRARPRQGERDRPAFQRQLPRDELCSARRHREENARRRARRPRGAKAPGAGPRAAAEGAVGDARLVQAWRSARRQAPRT